MRVLLTLMTLLLLGGCTSMLLGGSGTYQAPSDQCQQKNGEESKREC